MAMNNGRFSGEISGNSIQTYSNQLDYEVEGLDERKEIINEVLNIDSIGARDDFWMEIWDMANCKTSLNKDDVLWTDTNVANLLESFGTYLMFNCDDDNSRYSRPRKEVAMNNDYSTEDYILLKNDKNYRLAPPDEIDNSDYSPRKVFSKDYNYYKDVLYPEYIGKLKKKIIIDSENRYGCHDGSFDEFACSELMSEEKWNNLRRLELEKVKLLKEAKHNLDILKKQNKQIQGGTLYFRPYKKDIKQKTINVYKHDCMNRIVTPCHKQLERMGINNKEIKDIEEKYLYQQRTRSCGVGLRHITNNLSDIKDYMLSCKLAYNNRVCIDSGKNSANMDILEHVDYTNPKHIESILYMQGNEISYENDMSIISYDVTKAIVDLKRQGKLDDKDMYIIEGIRHKITQENIAGELGINRRSVIRRIDKIVDKIKSFW